MLAATKIYLTIKFNTGTSSVVTDINDGHQEQEISHGNQHFKTGVFI